MTKKSKKISTRLISETRDEFRAFLEETDFPTPQCFGERGPSFSHIIKKPFLFIGVFEDSCITSHKFKVLRRSHRRNQNLYQEERSLQEIGQILYESSVSA